MQVDFNFVNTELNLCYVCRVFVGPLAAKCVLIFRRKIKNANGSKVEKDLYISLPYFSLATHIEGQIAFFVTFRPKFLCCDKTARMQRGKWGKNASKKLVNKFVTLHS